MYARAQKRGHCGPGHTTIMSSRLPGLREAGVMRCAPYLFYSAASALGAWRMATSRRIRVYARAIVRDREHCHLRPCRRFAQMCGKQAHIAREACRLDLSVHKSRTRLTLHAATYL